MQLTGLTDILRDSAVYGDLVDHLRAETGLLPASIIRSARAFILATLARDWPGPIIYITARGKRAHNIAEQLPVWMSNERPILRFAEPTPMFYDRLAWDATVIRERLTVLNALMADASEQQPIIITSARALLQRTLPPQEFRRQLRQLRRGERVTQHTLIQQWLGIGYLASPIVLEPGTFSRRGGLLDIFPVGQDTPIRIEFFGDEIDTLRRFNPATQRTTATIDEVIIGPAREALPLATPPLARHLQAWFASQTDDADLASSLRQDQEALANGQTMRHLEHYLPYLYPNPVSLLDYAPLDALAIVEEIDTLQARIEGLIEDAQINRENNLSSHQLAPDHPTPYVPWPMLEEELMRRPTLHLTSNRDTFDETATSPRDTMRLFRPGDRFAGQLKPIISHIENASRHGDRVVIVSEQVERLAELWRQEFADAHLPRLDQVKEVPAPGTQMLVPGTLSEGWVFEDGNQRLHLITDAEIFNWMRPEPRRRKEAGGGRRKAPEADYADWQTGDYVVHVDYGIGRFSGLKSRTVEGHEREYLVIEYAGTDMLYVPIHQADRLTRYVGPEETPPQMNTLGKTVEWLKTRERAQKSAVEEARELLAIYARRASSPGFQFQPDTPWQRELEASFPYIETEDQIRAINDIKRDMESSMPMDRLVCGDVGYGKTEVALRAAFKAVMDGRQVAVLVPTTVLADQHYKTFGRRMAPFPLKVELLSRFRNRVEQTDISKALEEGKVDIIIGTHRILSDDIAIPNLGLVIIDEEQRFGVKHKEHFKKLRAHVDVLTMTATPIPRTLYMSLAGVRDISMIQTPPEERLPIITHVGSFNEKLARQAILREIDRGGQVFIIHNRIRTIETTRERFEQLVPEASIIIGHGQMTGRQLESVIRDFSAGQYDILLATSIIENGIDMPNVNTLIVDRADWFGMAQLYQIRGRVGRGAQQAYAYFFHPGANRLTEEARARLEALAEYTDLGAGFQMAVRDLELRGSGDILSTRQTGHIANIGLQLYTQLLQQAVRQQKGEADASATLAVAQERIIIDLPLPAYIPNDWIPEMSLRLQLYRRIGSLHSLEDISAMRQELSDRFGNLPPAVEGLLYQIHVKLLATTLRATAIIRPRTKIQIKLPWLASIDRGALAQELGDDVEVTRTAIEIPGDTDIWQIQLLDVLTHLQPETVEPTGA